MIVSSLISFSGALNIDSVKIASQMDLNPLAPSFRRMAFLQYNLKLHL